LELVNYLFSDAELQEIQEYANNVSIRRLGYNDHGPVHMRQVVGNAIKMLNILHDFGIKTSLEQEEVGTFDDSMCAVILAGLMHDLGMSISRQSHEKMSALLAQPIIDRTLMHMFPENLHKRVVIKAMATECIIGHMSSHKINSTEAGVLLIADGCDMTKGRARIPLSINTTPKVGDIHKYSANAIKWIGIHHGERRPIKIDIEMTSEVGFFQIEEVLLEKINASPAKQFVELYAGVEGEERKCYL
jgi:metal-dependent HD superfamily phosphatase/phosphodiesterase